jgi:hypothetical protein
MAGSITVTYPFQAQTGPIPLAQLDANFSQTAVAINDAATYSNYFADTGGVNAIVVTINAPQTFTYSTGVSLDIKIGNTNTGAVTINVNGLGAKNVTTQSIAALISGQLVVGGIYTLKYDGTQFQIVGSNVSPLGLSITKVKAAGTTRSTVTVLANDPDLVYAIPIAGTYAYELIAYPVQSLAGSVGIGCNINYSGTFTALGSLCISDGLGTTVAAPAVPGTTGTLTTSTLNIGAFNSVNNGFVRFRGTILATGTGTLGFAWAQFTSSATTLTINAGSSLIITRLS